MPVPPLNPSEPHHLTLFPRPTHELVKCDKHIACPFCCVCGGKIGHTVLPNSGSKISASTRCSPHAGRRLQQHAFQDYRFVDLAIFSDATHFEGKTTMDVSNLGDGLSELTDEQLRVRLKESREAIESLVRRLDDWRTQATLTQLMTPETVLETFRHIMDEHPEVAQLMLHMGVGALVSCKAVRLSRFSRRRLQSERTSGGGPNRTDHKTIVFVHLMTFNRTLSPPDEQHRWRRNPERTANVDVPSTIRLNGRSASARSAAKRHGQSDRKPRI